MMVMIIRSLGTNLHHFQRDLFQFYSKSTTDSPLLTSHRLFPASHSRSGGDDAVLLFDAMCKQAFSGGQQKTEMARTWPWNTTPEFNTSAFQPLAMIPSTLSHPVGNA